MKKPDEQDTFDQLKIRARSGFVDSDDPLVSFLYVLIRDDVVPGRIEEIMKMSMPPAPDEKTEFSNGWLASYAKDIAARLKK